DDPQTERLCPRGRSAREGQMKASFTPAPCRSFCHGNMSHELLMVLALLLASGFTTSCRRTHAAAATPDPLLGAYDSEPDWNDATKVIPLNYQQAQGKRVFYQNCVWCHADSTPAGPSNRSNLNPNPPLANDGATLNALSDEFMRNVITMGGAAAGKSAAMPRWGKTLNRDDIEAVI